MHYQGLKKKLRLPLSIIARVPARCFVRTPKLKKYGY